jgi:hypothetical protein
MREYEDMAIKVGNKISIEIRKSDTSGIFSTFDRSKILSIIMIQLRVLASPRKNLLNPKDDLII